MHTNLGPRTFGAALSASARGKKVSDVNRIAGFVEEIGKHELFCRSLCKVAAAVYAFEGAEGSTNGIAFSRLADPRTPWKPGYRAFSDIVLGAIGRAAPMRKQAFLEEAILAPTVIKEMNVSTPMRMALAAGVLGGAVGGTGLHFLSRNARQTSVENEALLQKAREYRRLRQEIDEDMHNSGLNNEETDVRHEL